MTQQTKDDAREETLRRWNALPDDDHQTFEQANVFAAALADQLDFRTMGNRRRVILGWLVRHLDGLPPWGNIEPESIAALRPRIVADTVDHIPDTEDHEETAQLYAAE